MVLREEFFPNGHGGYQKQGYDQDYYPKDGCEHKEDYYSDHSYHGNSSSMQMERPNITTPEPAKHFVVGGDSHGYPKESSGDYGKHYQNNHHDHDLTNGQGFPGGGAHHSSDGMFGKTSHTQGGYNFGQQIHGYPKATSPFGGGNYEYERNVKYVSEPVRHESMSYYYGVGRNHYPRRPLYEGVTKRL